MRYRYASMAIALFWVSNLLAQLPVSQVPENKNVVLEEFTGIYCTFCPDGHRLANQFKAANPDDVILVNIHAGGYASPNGNDPDFRTIHGTLIAGSAGIVGYPAGTINRRHFAQYTQGGGTAMSRGQWASAGNIVLGEASYVNIAMDATYDINTDKIHVDVEMYLTGSIPSGGGLSLVVALLQNNVEGPQTGKSSNPSQVLPNGNYNHSHMLRDLLSTSRYGDNVDFSAGSLATMSFVYDVPADIGGIATVPHDMDVVAYLLETPSYEIITGCETEMLVGNLSSDEYSTDIELKVYPNPAQNVVNIHLTPDENSTLEVEIFDLSGRLVRSFSRSYISTLERTETIDLQGLAAGSYMLQTNVNGHKSSTKLLIQE